MPILPYSSTFILQFWITHPSHTPSPCHPNGFLAAWPLAPRDLHKQPHCFRSWWNGHTRISRDPNDGSRHQQHLRLAYCHSDCLDNTPDTNLQTVSYGRSKIKMRANDGANHIGPCTVYLVNPGDVSDKLQVGQLDDCMRSLHPAAGNKGDDPIPAEMGIDVPESGLPCSPEHCVLEFYWEATHLEPHELFNNCADVKLCGSSSASTTGNESGSAVATTETPTMTPEAPTATTTAPATHHTAPSRRALLRRGHQTIGIPLLSFHKRSCCFFTFSNKRRHVCLA